MKRFITSFLMVLLIGTCTVIFSPDNVPSKYRPSYIVPLTSTQLISPSLTNVTAPAIPLLPQGLYDSCVPDSAECLDHLNHLAEKGFKLILNYGQLYSGAEAQIAYADQAQSLGMKVIWSIQYRANRADDWMIKKYTNLSAESNCKENYCLIKYFIDLVKDHQATWGYYVADEVHPEEFEKMKKWTELIKELDPAHPRLFVSAGSNDPMEQYYGFYSYMRELADVFGPDYYPYGYIESGNQITRFTGATAKHAQYWADKLDGESVIVLQAFSLSRYSSTPLCLPWPACAPFPTLEQMKAQRDQVLYNSDPKIILWWTYQDILKTSDPEKHLNDLASAAFAPYPVKSLEVSVPTGWCPNSWICEDIGNPQVIGSQSIKDGIWEVEGAGWNIWAEPWVKADQFRYVWQELPKDGGGSAQFIAQTSTNPLAKSGIMLRKSFDPVSPYYAVFVTPDSKIIIHNRTDYGKVSQELSNLSVEIPIFIKITSSNTIFNTYVSKDGLVWKFIPGSRTKIDRLQGDLMFGLAVTSGNEAEINTAHFEHVSIFDDIHP